MADRGEHATAAPGASVHAPVFGKPLCAIDGKEGGFAALEQAASLTAPGSELTMLLVTSFRKDGAHRAPAINAVRAKEIIDEAKELAERAGVELWVEVEPATPPAEVVLEYAAGHDLLAIGAPASSWLGGMLVAGVGDSAISSLETPLLTARHTAAPASGFEHVVIASDGLDDCHEAIAVGGAIARSHRSRLTLLHALGGHGHRHHDRVMEQGEELSALADRDPDVVFKRGSAHGVICECAEQTGASLVVAGSRRRAGVRVLGSVSRRVVHEAPCSVLTVPPGTSAPV